MSMHFDTCSPLIRVDVNGMIWHSYCIFVSIAFYILKENIYLNRGAAPDVFIKSLITGCF